METLLAWTDPMLDKGKYNKDVRMPCCSKWDHYTIMLLRGAKGRIHLFTIKSYICEFIEFIFSFISFGDLPLGVGGGYNKMLPWFLFYTNNKIN